MDWESVLKNVLALVKPQRDFVANTANVSALIYSECKKANKPVNWCGFYLVRPIVPQKSGGDSLAESSGSDNAKNESADAAVLILGPFQGKPAVVRIPFGQGVCGTCCVELKTQLVPDVHLHPNHIECDSASRSEIVVPVFCAHSGKLVAVLDIDSPVTGGFTAKDQEGLEAIVNALSEHTQWDNVSSWFVEANASDHRPASCALKKYEHR